MPLSQRALKYPGSYVRSVTPDYVRKLIEKYPEAVHLADALRERDETETAYFRKITLEYLGEGKMKRNNLFYELIFACSSGSEEYADRAIDGLIGEGAILEEEDYLMLRDPTIKNRQVHHMSD